jgi:mannose-1-phosphate guanylyltransferase
MLHAVIMAGGSGTRFWPASRHAKPKQLLTFTGNRSMIQSTVDRLDGLVPAEHILIVTGKHLVEPIAAELPQLPANAILGEPCRRDTAPCIGLAASLLACDDSEATMIVMPADHVIEPVAAFQQAIREAAALVEDDPTRIVTFGIKPTYPAESFGYIERGEALPGSDATYKVRKFREKPNADVAREYVDSGNFYWNSGIFIWRASTILNALAEHEPAMYKHLMTIATAAGTDKFDSTLQAEFAKIIGKSIDFAVMEHYENVLVCEAPFDWNDVGSWGALPQLAGTDDQQNTIEGKHIGVDTECTIVRSEGDHLIVTIGLRDCIVVHTADATLVADRSQEEQVRQAVKRMEENGWKEYL